MSKTRQRLAKVRLAVLQGLFLIYLLVLSLIFSDSGIIGHDRMHCVPALCPILLTAPSLRFGALSRNRALSHRAVGGLYTWRLNHKMPGVMIRSNWRGGDLWILTSLSSLHSHFDFFQRFVNGTNSWEKNNERSNSHYFIRLIMRITTIYSDNQ